jgi:hypothetical protein
LDAFDAIVSWPVAEPLDCGAKATLKLTAWPGLRVTGGFTPLTLKTAMLLEISDIVTAVPPPLVSVSESSLLLALGIVPNCRFAALAARTPELPVLPPLDEVELKLHPVPASSETATTKSASRTGDRRCVMKRLLTVLLERCRPQKYMLPHVGGQAPL